MKKVFSYSFILLIAFSLFSENLIAQSAWNIFMMPASTKPKPVTAVASIRGDLSGIFYNPSILGSISQREIFVLTEIEGMAEDSFFGGLYGHPLKFGKGAGISGGFVYYDAGRTTLYWMEGGETKEDEISLEKDFLAILSYGQKFTEKFYLGLNYKYATSNIAEITSASAQAFDLGFLFLPKNNVVVSVAGQNIGRGGKFLETEEKLPLSYWIGASYTKNKLSVGLDIPYIVDEKRFIPGIGFEYVLGDFSLSLGYRTADEAVLQIGIGIKTKDFDFGYSFIPSTYLNSPQRISFGYLF